VSNRVKELLERERLLQARCAAQRAFIAEEVAAIEARFSNVDRMAGIARSVLLRPAVVVGAVVALVAIGRTRGMRIIGKLYLLATTARRLMQAVRMFTSTPNDPRREDLR
jgi:hypothetical protein